MSQWHTSLQADEVPTTWSQVPIPEEIQTCEDHPSSLETVANGFAVNLDHSMPSENAPDYLQPWMENDQTRVADHTRLESSFNALNPQLQSCPSSNPSRGSLSNSFTPSDSLAFYDQFPYWSPTTTGDPSIPHSADPETDINHSEIPFDELVASLEMINAEQMENTVQPNSAPSSIPHDHIAFRENLAPKSTQVPVPLPSPRSHLPRRRSRYFVKRWENNSTPIAIPTIRSSSPSWTGTNLLGPMQRWQESPPEDEPASMSAIYNALKDSSLDLPGQVARKRDSGASNQSNTLESFRNYRRAASTTSVDSAASTSSRHSANSAQSRASSTSQSPYPSTSRKPRAPRSKHLVGDQSRMFQCTFCCDTFKHKYDWTRHEKSLHLNMEEWKCAPHGTSVLMASTGRIHCAYCHLLDPSLEHMESHNYQACQADSALSRVFRRKDHLVQHLRLVHHLDTLPLIDDWKVPTPAVSSRCGFCDLRLASWDDRSDHLASHFRKGIRMKDWKGDWGFDDFIQARVTNAIPPYLIGSESQSLVPFSATSSGAKDHFAQISSHIRLNSEQNTTKQNGTTEPSTAADSEHVSMSKKAFTDLLMLHLNQYAQEQFRLGNNPTDEAFQQEARRVLFDCEDTWNQTIVDNPEWMAAFRRQLVIPATT